MRRTPARHEEATLFMMSLIPFHRGLIATAIVFCFGYGGWELVAFARTGANLSLVVGILFLGLGAGLAYYLSRLNRFLGVSSHERSGPDRS